MRTPRPPAAPDPVRTAQAQTTSNVNTGVANTIIGNANEIGPTGSVTYNQIGSQNVGGIDVPQYERVTQLSPEQQAIYNQQTQFQQGVGSTANTLLGNVNQQLGTPIDANATTPRASGVIQGPNLQGINGALPTYQTLGNGPQFDRMGQGPELDRMANNDWSQDRQRVEDALYSRLNPQLDQDRAALENRLANQGIRAGSEAYREAIALNDRQRNDARMQTILAGGQEQSRLAGLDQSRLGFNNNVGQQGFQNQLTTNQFNNNAGQQGFQNQQAATAFNNLIGQQGLQDRMAVTGFNNNVGQRGFANDIVGRNFQNETRDAEIQEQIRLRGNQLNELNALISGAQVAMPQGQAFNAGTIGNTDVAGITQQGYQNQLAAFNQAQQQQGAMLGGIAGLAGTVLGGPIGGAMAGSMFGGIGGGGGYSSELPWAPNYRGF
jgi:hypothetical protein